MAVRDEELAALVEEELDQALAMSWTEVSRVTPWGDSYVGFTASGAEVEIERNYLWEGEGEAIRVEVSVRPVGARTAEAVASVTIPKP